MTRIRVKNFGPIKQGKTGGSNDWLDFRRVTMFIGEQASGKSSVAKLASCLTWIEKALVRGDFSENTLASGNSFVNHCKYQNIESYFKEETSIEFEGGAYDISYIRSQVNVKKKEENGYLVSEDHVCSG